MFILETVSYQVKFQKLFILADETIL